MAQRLDHNCVARTYFVARVAPRILTAGDDLFKARPRLGYSLEKALPGQKAIIPSFQITRAHACHLHTVEVRATGLAVVNCAYGCEKENQEETDQTNIKEDHRQKAEADDQQADDQQADKEEGNF
jgi:hypothetical protein